MRTIRTTTGAELVLDNDLLAVLETLYREVTIKQDLDRSFEDIVREIGHLFIALGAAAQPSCALPLPVKQQERVEEETKRLIKLLSRRDRKKSRMSAAKF